MALACLGAAYERLDEQASEQLEQQLFGPASRAYGLARRTYAQFAARYGLPAREFGQASPGPESQGPRELIERAAEAVRRADEEIATLQDSMLPVDVGDVELRSGLSSVRTTIADTPRRALELIRVVGR